jgi:hypothetical protein
MKCNSGDLSGEWHEGIHSHSIKIWTKNNVFSCCILQSPLVTAQNSYVCIWLISKPVLARWPWSSLTPLSISFGEVVFPVNPAFLKKFHASLNMWYVTYWGCGDPHVPSLPVPPAQPLNLLLATLVCPHLPAAHRPALWFLTNLCMLPCVFPHPSLASPSESQVSPQPGPFVTIFLLT